MTGLLIEIVAGWLRIALGALSVYLIEHHVLTAGQGDRLTSELLNHALLVLPMVLALVWSLLSKRLARSKFLTALALAPGSTEADVRDQLWLGRAPSVTTPSDQAPRIGAWFVAMILGASLATSGCALAARSSRAPVQTPAERAAIQRELAAYATTLREVAVGLKAFQVAEIQLHADHAISDATHRTIQGLLVKAADAGDAAITAIADVSAPTATRRELADAFVRAVRTLITESVIAVPDPKVRVYVQIAAAGLQSLIAILGSFTPF